MFENTPRPGAPLRNRTVDLLLTIRAFLGSLPSTMPVGPVAAAARPVSGPAAGGETCRLRETARVSPGPAPGGIMGIRHAIQAQSVRPSPARPRPGDDQMTVRRSCCLYGKTRNALLSRRFRYRQEPDDSPSPDTVGDHRHGGGGIRGHHHQSVPAETETAAGMAPYQPASQPGTGLPASSGGIQVMNSAIAANWQVAAAQTYAWKISW